MPSLTLRKPSPIAIASFVDRGEADELTPPPVPEPALAAVPALQPSKVEPAESRRRAVRAQATPPDDVPSFTRASRSLATRRTKPDRRRTTVYFDLDVARDLACRLGDEDMSDVVNAAVRAHLAKR